MDSLYIELESEGRNAKESVLGWRMCPQIHVHPEPQNTSLFRNRIFADVISSDDVILDYNRP